MPLGLLQRRRCCSSATRSPRAAPRSRPTHIRDAIANGSMEAGSLLTASLARNQDAIRTGRRPSRPRARSGVAGRRARDHAVRARAAALRLRQPAGASRFAAACSALEPRLLPRVRLVARAGGVRRQPPRAALLVLRGRLGAEHVRVHLLRAKRRAVRHGRAGRGAEGSPRRSLQRLPGVPEDDRPPRALAVSARRHRRHGDDGSRSGGDGARLRPAAAQGVHAKRSDDGTRGPRRRALTATLCAFAL